jgi:polyhydroxyalkanoate synthase
MSQSEDDMSHQRNAQISEEIGQLMDKIHAIIQKQMNYKADDGFQLLHPVVFSNAIQDMVAKMIEKPEAIIKEQYHYWQDLTRLWQQTSRSLLGEEAGDPIVTPIVGDRRFSDKEWLHNPGFNHIKQFYLLTSRYLTSLVDKVEGLDKHTAQKASFFTRQIVDALSPSNFVTTNPEVLRETIESKGENLLRGLKEMLDDLERGDGNYLNIKQTDLSAFKIGDNIAQTPCEVIFQNDLMQLLYYHPSTEKVLERPLLIVPPWINKFYILDLKPKNSLIKWAIDQGHSVFVISWINPDQSLADKGFDNYMIEGPLAALNCIEDLTGSRKINTIGYCIGGTLLATTAAWMASQKDNRIASVTFLTTLLDFSDVGELSVFIDETQISSIEGHMKNKGYLEGHYLSMAFSMLRENDLIWSVFVKNYLLGREPLPFDLLYWNSDSTNMPAAMHSFYLRNMYLNNLLRKPKGLSVHGVAIDLKKIKCPTYFLSARDDHIAPWKSTFIGTSLIGGRSRFVLSGSGHIAGVINPPIAQKYCYWTNENLPENCDEWLENAQENPGSWWNDWDHWIKAQDSKLCPARDPKTASMPILEEGPGSYVMMKRQ